MRRPIWHALLARIAERGGEQPIWDRIASGETNTSIAASYETSRGHFEMWLRKPVRVMQYQAARLRRPAAQELPPETIAVLKAGGEPAMLDQVRSGTTLTKIAKAVGMTYPQVLAYFNRTPERKARYQAARLESAGALADQAIDLVDAADVSKPETANANIRKAETQATLRKWRAGITDRKNYGTETGEVSQITIGALHLNALMKLGGPQQPPALPALEGAAYEVHQIEPA